MSWSILLFIKIRKINELTGLVRILYWCWGVSMDWLVNVMLTYANETWINYEVRTMIYWLCIELMISWTCFSNCACVLICRDGILRKSWKFWQAIKQKDLGISYEWRKKGVRVLGLWLDSWPWSTVWPKSQHLAKS